MCLIEKWAKVTIFLKEKMFNFTNRAMQVKTVLKSFFT